MPLDWTLDWDDAENTIHEALSFMCADSEGDHFTHRVSPVLEGDAIRWRFTSDEEIRLNDDERFATAAEAMAACEAVERDAFTSAARAGALLDGMTGEPIPAFEYSTAKD